MDKWVTYRDNVIEYATPYVKKAGICIGDVAKKIDDKYNKSKRKVKHGIRLRKISNMLDLLSNIIMLVAAIMALLAVFNSFQDRFDD